MSVSQMNIQTGAPIVQSRLKIELSNAQIQSLLNGGVLELPITADQTTNLKLHFEERFWQFHCPYGSPGDVLWGAEPFVVCKSCDHVSDGKVVHQQTIQYGDGIQWTFENTPNWPATSQQHPANSMPAYFSRLRLVIQSISVNTALGVWTIQVLNELA